MSSPTTMQKMVFHSAPTPTLGDNTKQEDYSSATSTSERPKSTVERYYARSIDQETESKEIESDDDKHSFSTDAEEPKRPRKKSLGRRFMDGVCKSIAGRNIYA